MITKEDFDCLISLQEKEIVIAESSIIYPPKEALDHSDLLESVQDLRDSLPQALVLNYDRNQKSKGLGIAYEKDGRCKSCHMPVALSDINRMKKSLHKAPSCPNCGIMLYLECFMEPSL